MQKSGACVETRLFFLIVKRNKKFHQFIFPKIMNNQLKEAGIFVFIWNNLH